MKPKVYKDGSWVLRVYASGGIPVRVTGFSSANDAVNALKQPVIACMVGGHVFVKTTHTTFCENCRTYLAIGRGVSKED